MPRREHPGRDAGQRKVADNRRARFEYELLERFEAGLVLTGSEVKSVRGGGVQLGDAHVAVQGGEAWLLNCHIGPYANAGYAQHEAMRPRKLLLHRAEIYRLERGLQTKGLTVVATRLYFAGARVKIEIALARGKKLHDKRETIKKRDEARHAQRAD